MCHPRVVLWVLEAEKIDSFDLQLTRLLQAGQASFALCKVLLREFALGELLLKLFPAVRQG